jgi:hypothetical protein
MPRPRFDQKIRLNILMEMMSRVHERRGVYRDPGRARGATLRDPVLIVGPPLAGMPQVFSVANADG